LLIWCGAIEFVPGFSAGTERIEEMTGSLAAIGVGLVTVGAGIGIGILGASAVSGIARQPEVTGKIQTNMLIAAALIEGIALFCAVICIIAK
jgi:F-type H+-transporting ATPase subunit c